MWGTFLGFLVLIFNISNAYCEYRYDYTYSKTAKGWFKLHKVPATFEDAFLRCNFEGAVLASPLNDDLQDILTSMHRDSNLISGMYTGIHATFSQGDYMSVEGVPLEKIQAQWAAGEPDNFQNEESCLIMLRNETLADVKCNETYPYVCFKNKTKNPVLSECGTEDPEYKKDNRTGNCYKFHRVGMSWKRAHMACHAEGGHLVIINSIAEAQIVKELFVKNPPSTIKTVSKDTASVGFSLWGTSGLWYTVHGERLEEAGYSSWKEHQPDNSVTRKEYCGAVFRNGLLDDVMCDGVNRAFICEKTPESLMPDEERR